MDSNVSCYTRDNFHIYLADHNNLSTQLIDVLLKRDSKDWVSNVKTDMIALTAGDEAWAVTINHKEYDNALICSPYTTYVTYPLDELVQFDKLWIKSLILLNSAVMGVLCRLTQFNRVVQINNNLNSLLKHPKQFTEVLPELTKQMIQRYPKCAINFFRVNNLLDTPFLKALRENGYIVFPDRPVHVYMPNTGYMRRSNTRRDIALLRNTQYQVVTHDELKLTDSVRITELYRHLFIDKQSKKNPIYTAKYFQAAIKNHWHEYLALRSPDGRIDGFISWFYREGVMVCGPLGYDKTVSIKLGLYRQLVALCLKHADEKQIPFNMGGGSDLFKTNRGSTQVMEYTAVYCQHLPFYRHIPWRIMSFACNKMLKKIVSSGNL